MPRETTEEEEEKDDPLQSQYATRGMVDDSKEDVL